MTTEPPDFELESVSKELTAKGGLAAALREARKDLYAVAAFSLAANILVLALPLYTLQVYDRVLSSRSADTLLLLTLVAAFLLFGFGLLDMLRQRILSRAAARLESRIDREVFDALLERRISGNPVNEAEILGSLFSLRHFAASNGVLAILDIPWTPLFIAIIFLLHPALGAIALFGALGVIGLAVASHLMMKPAFARSVRHSVQSTKFGQNILRAAESVASMGMSVRARDIWRGLLHRSIDEQIIGGDELSLFNSAAKTVRLLLQIAILGAGAALVISDQLSAGAMIAAVILMSRAMTPAEQLFGSWNGIVSALANYRRLDEILRTSHRRDPEMLLPAPTGRLSVESLAGAAPGASDPFLHDITFELAPGEMLGVIGPSGSGKTMLMRMLAGLWSPISGAIRIDHAELHHWRRDDLGKFVGFLPQDIQLVGGTVLSNIARLETPDHEAVVDAAQLAGVHEMILALPKGYDTQIGEGGNRLSAGQRQRLGLARAIYKMPRLVLLDEPNAFLDAEGEIALRHAIQALKESGATVIVVSHRPGPLAAADKLLLLKNGRMELFGPKDMILPQVTRPLVEQSEDRRVVPYRKEADER